MAPGNWCDHQKNFPKNKKRDDGKNSDDPFAWSSWVVGGVQRKSGGFRLPASAHSSQESDLEHLVKVASRKHCIYTHFPIDQNCEVCTGEAVPRAKKFGDLITAHHKVLNQGSESRRNHRYAVVVQDLATQWIQSCSCKTKTPHETERSLSKFFELSHKPKVENTDKALEFRKACEHLSWNHRTSTHHRFEINGIAERAVRRVREGTSAFLLQSGLDERWWSGSMECYCFLRNVQDLLADGKTSYERRSGESVRWPIMSSGALIEYHPISPREQAMIHQFGKNVLPGIFLGYELIAWWIWKGDVLIADLEDLGKMDASEIYLRRINAKEVLTTQKEDDFIFPFADGTAKLSGRDHEFREPTQKREPTASREDFSRELQGEPGDSQPTESTDDAEARAEFWSIQGDFIHRHHNEPRVQLYVPKEETFPIPLKHIDVTRSSQTDLDVLQEKRTDDFWNVDSNRHLSDSWKLDNARRQRNLLYRSRWRRIHRNSPKREEKTGKTFGTSHAMQKITKWHHGSDCEAEASEKKSQTVESHESTRQRVESSQPVNHEDHVAGEGVYIDVSLQLGTQAHSDAPSDGNSGCTSRSGQGMEKARDDSSMEFGRNHEQKGGNSRSTKRQKGSPRCHIDGNMSPRKMRRWNQNYRIALWEDIVKDDSGAYAVFTEQGMYVRSRWLPQK